MPLEVDPPRFSTKVHLRVQFLQQEIQATYHACVECRMFPTQRILWQYLQEGTQRVLRLPQGAEGGFLEIPTCASEVHGAPRVGEELAGD